MGKEEKNPEKKKKTNLDFVNLIIEYANESGGNYKKELIKAGKLLGKGEPFALVRYLDTMDVTSREMFFKILSDNKNPMSIMEEEQRAMSKGFKCPECGGKSVEEQKLASCSSPEGGEFPMHFSTCLKCKNEIPDHIGFRWEKMTVAQAKEEWEEFKNDEYFDSN